MSSDNLDDTFHEPNPGFKALLSKWQTQDAFGGGAAGSTSSHITKYAFRKSRQVAQTEYRERKTSDKDYKASEKAIEEEKPKAVVAPARKSGDARPKKPTGPRPQHLNNVYQKPLEDVSGFKPPVYPKNALEKELIQTALRKNFVFSDLGAQSLAPMVDAFEQCSFETDAMIIRQGDPGDFFYIIKSGKVIFEVNGKDVGRAGEGASFGELSLLYTCPRAATVIAAEPSKLFRVDQNTFRYILQSQTQQSEQEKIQLLQNVSFLKDLGAADLQKLSAVMTPRVFEKDELIVKKGTIGDAFYVLQEGKVICCDISVGSTAYEDQTLGPGEYFGERSLATAEPRAANVKGLTKGVAFSIDRDTFEKVLGSMSSLIDRAQDVRKLAGARVLSDLGLDARQLSTLSTLIVDKKFAAGKSIMKRGKTTKSALYFVREGKVSLKRKNGSLMEVPPGGYFGEPTFRDDCEFRSGTAKALYTARAVGITVCGVLTVLDSRAVFDTSKLAAVTDMSESALDSGTPAQKLLRPARGASVVTEATVESTASDEEAMDIDASEVGFLDIQPPMETSAELQYLKRHKILGEGTFGQVWLVSETKHDGSQIPYALKIQSKSDLACEGQIKAVIQEKNIMQKMRHPFIINLVKTYQDENLVYILLELVQGGELFSVLHQGDESGLPEAQAKFYSLGIADALAFMHRGKYVFRDLKPESVMINTKGYPILIDFGFAKRVEDKTYTLCGTPGFLSPEVVMTRGHNAAADHWSFGILVYELVTGENPFFYEGMDQMSLFQSIVQDDFDDPVGASSEVTDLCRKLLIKDPTLRLGSLARGERDILEHPWFAELDLPAMLRFNVKAPWVPEISDPLDTSWFDDWSHLEDRTQIAYEQLRPADAALFEAF